MFEITTSASAVQALIGPALVLLGVSHIVQPNLWREFFVWLHSLGTKGVVIRTFALELWPALLIVIFHQEWRGPAILLTIYGWLLLAKVTLSLLQPQLGLRSLGMAEGVSDRGWAIAGGMLIGLGAASLAALLRI